MSQFWFQNIGSNPTDANYYLFIFFLIFKSYVTTFLFKKHTSLFYLVFVYVFVNIL